MNRPESAALIGQIEQLAVPPGQLALWSLGQAGFVIKGGDMIAYIDPYLSDPLTNGVSRRRFPVPIDPSTIAHAQLIFATHEHGDHADPTTLSALMQASPQATLISTPQVRAIAIAAGIAEDRVRVARLGERVEAAGLAYSAIPAAHYAYEVDSQQQSRWLGFLIECNGVTLYHAGDTLVIPEILDALSGAAIDLALLPINGRDFFREQRHLTGNMWPGEAIELAVQLQARVLLALHNDLFAGNRVNPGMLFTDLDAKAPWQRCHILQPGELYLYAG